MKSKLHPGVYLAVLTVIGALQPSALALKYKPKPRETLSHVALIHYGDPKKYTYLSTANHIANPNRIPENITLWVPTVWRYQIKKGDNLAKLAAKYMRDSTKSEFLIWLNQIRNPLDIKPGMLITIPFVLRHRVLPGENMADVAKKYYFRVRKVTGLLRKYNSKRTNTLKTGEMIDIPIFDQEALYSKVKERLVHYEQQLAKATQEARQQARRQANMVQTNEPSQEAPRNQPEAIAAEEETTWSSPWTIARMLASFGSERQKQPKTSPATTNLLESALDLYWDGEFERSRASLEELLEQHDLSQADEAKARELLASCLVAMDRTQEAEEQFVYMLMAEPERTLDPATTSPKIIKAFQRAKKKR